MNPQTALLLIDVQTGLDDPALGKRNNPDAETQMTSLLHHWRTHGWPVIHVQHCSTEPRSPLRPELPGVAIKDCVAPMAEEPVIKKQVNSAFINTPLNRTLTDANISTLVVVGLTTDHCVSSSVRMAADQGYDVFLISDATATFDRTGPDGTYYPAQTMHDVNLASVNGEFCQVMNTRELLETPKG